MEITPLGDSALIIRVVKDFGADPNRSLDLGTRGHSSPRGCRDSRSHRVRSSLFYRLGLLMIRRESNQPDLTTLRSRNLKHDFKKS